MGAGRLEVLEGSRGVGGETVADRWDIPLIAKTIVKTGKRALMWPK